MSNFNELLKQPLPSKGFSYFESDLDDDCCTNDIDDSEFDTDDDMGGYSDSGYPSTDDPFADDEDDDELDADDDYETNDTVNPFASQSMSRPTFSQTEDADDKELDPVESQHVDDTMNTVATPLLINDELKDDEVEEFVESVDADIAVNEGFLTEKTIIKFDKNAKKSQLFEVAVLAIANEKRDPLYKKLKTLWKMERTIKAKLRKKYHTPANQKVKEYLARARKSKLGLLSKIANKLSKKK